MKVYLKNNHTGKEQLAIISAATKKELPFKKDGWQFNWRELFKTKDATFFKITLEETPKVVEGMLMLTMANGDLVVMSNVEIAPHNYGKNGIYKNTAGCLIAYACKESFDRGIGHYRGFLSFQSKTKLIRLYEEKYGAQISMSPRMFIDQYVGMKLVKEYLNLELKN